MCIRDRVKGCARAGQELGIAKRLHKSYSSTPGAGYCEGEVFLRSRPRRWGAGWWKAEAELTWKVVAAGIGKDTWRRWRRAPTEPSPAEGSRSSPGGSRSPPGASRASPGASRASPEASGEGPDASQSPPAASEISPGGSGSHPDASKISPDVSGLPPEPSRLPPGASGVFPDASGRPKSPTGGFPEDFRGAESLREDVREDF